MLQTVREEKFDEKSRVICLVSMFSLLSKKVHFLQFCADLSKISNLLKQFTYMHPKGLVTLFYKMVLFIMLTYCFRDTRVWRWKILLNFCWVSIFFHILIVNITWTVVRTSMNHTIFWKRVTRLSDAYA